MVLRKVSFRNLPRIISKGKSQEKFVESTFELSNQELSQQYKVSPSTIKDWKKQFQRLGVETGEGGLPASTTPDFDEYLVIEDDRAIVIGDAEVPDHDVELFSMVVDLAQKLDITTLIINGDFIVLDSFSRWAKTAVYQLAFQQELDPVVQSLKVFLGQFGRIVYISGNHERRLTHKVDGHMTIGLFLENLAGVSFSEYSYCILKSAGRDFLVCHPDSYSKVSLRIPREIASIKLMSVIAGHTHHLAVGYDRSGKYYIVDGGHCRDQKKTRYKSIKVTTHPEWNAGFVLVLKGVPYVVDKSSYEFWSQVSLPSNFWR